MLCGMKEGSACSYAFETTLVHDPVDNATVLYLYSDQICGSDGRTYKSVCRMILGMILETDGVNVMQVVPMTILSSWSITY